MSKSGSKSMIVILGLLAFFLTGLSGCPYSSSVPLSPSSKAEIDEALLGNWGFFDKDEVKGELVILPFSDHEILIMAVEEGKPLPETYRAYNTVIAGENFLNVQPVTESTAEKRSWLFVNYIVTSDKLRYRIVDHVFFENKKENMSSKELMDLIKDNLNNKELYGESDGYQVLKRMETMEE